MKGVTVPWLSLLGLLAGGLVIRLAVLDVPGHAGDVSIIARWAESMAAVGPWGFYDTDRSLYPALLYVLWPLGILFDGEALARAVKGLSIPFDLGIGVLLFAISRSMLGTGRALIGAGLYLLNPSVLLAGPIWGQVDSAGTLAFLAALGASSSRRDGLAGTMAVVAVLVKPQFGLVLLPVVVAATIRARRERSREPLVRLVGGGLASSLLITGPLLLHPGRYAALLADAAARQPMTSLHAFNPWGLLVGFGVPDEPYAGLSTALLAIAIPIALLRLRRGTGLIDLLATGTMLAIAFYFVPTRIHERYFFPVIALMAPLALVDRTLLAVYGVISIGFAASLLYALHQTTAFRLPEPIAIAITSPAGVWVIGLVLMSASAVAVWRMAVNRQPRTGQCEPPFRAARRRRSR